MARVTTALFLVAVAALASAQDEFRDGRVRYQEPGVLMQRAGESEAEEAFVNAPFLPGDRLWTDGSGRAELQFEGTTFVRIDSRGKLDFVGREQGRRNERIALRLWSGGVYVRIGEGRYSPDFELETPGGLVEFLDRGVYRVDVEAGETRLSVYDGEAALDSGGRRVRVDSGERTYARRDEEPERPHSFDRDGDFDDFARWDQEREDRVAWARGSERYLPEDVGYYGGELDESGSWYYEAEVGHVWRPYVATGWQPYANGHWVWTSWGWTWVPYDPWGWVTFHYGRWGHSPAIGWYWIPGSVWGPAWVSWAVGGNYVGWCPLGYRDRPVLVHDVGRVKGYAVPRGSAPRPGATTASASTEGNPVAGFTFVNKADMGKRLAAQRRFAAPADAARSMQIVDSQRASLSRELKLADARPAAQATRTVKTRPTFGDTVPELRSDPTTTIPFWRRGDRKQESDRDQRYKVDSQPNTRPTDQRSPRSTVQPNRSEEPRWQARPEPGSRPTDLRSSRTPAARTQEPDDESRRSRPVETVEPERRTTPTPWTAPPRSNPSTQRDAPRDSNLRDREAPPRREPEHDVLRRFFQPLNEGRTRNEGGERSAAPRSEPRAPAPVRVEPRRAAPPPPPPQPAQGERAKPKKEKHN